MQWPLAMRVTLGLLGTKDTISILEFRPYHPSSRRLRQYFRASQLKIFVLLHLAFTLLNYLLFNELDKIDYLKLTYGATACSLLNKEK